MTRPLRIAQVAPPLERVPPRAYGGTERVIHELDIELVRRGHEVTTFASGDSDVPGRLVPTVPEALRPAGYTGDHLPYFLMTIDAVLDRAAEFDVIHSHLEWSSLLLARVSPVPVVSTFHGRLDLPWATDMLQDPPDGLVAISENQASTHPDVPWSIVHNGLTLTDSPFERRRGDSLCFVGRVAPEKGIVEAMEIARLAGRRLRIAAKVAPAGPELEYHNEVFAPALKAAGSAVEYLGEVDQAERDQLLAESYASLMPGAWPEPFGLVAIESLACGTPIIARRIGALPEIIREGVDGFFGDDSQAMAFLVDRVAELDRAAIRRSVLERFSAQRMADGYEAVYRRVLAAASGTGDGPGSASGDDEALTPIATRRVDHLEALATGR
jgi:glycosyltransferase involved in cell wall biosynthesis